MVYTKCRHHVAITAKRNTHVAVLAKPTSSNKAAYQAVQSRSSKVHEACSHRYWNDLCTRITKCAGTGNTVGMYSGIKEAIGLAPRKSAPLNNLDGTALTETVAQLNCWVEHYVQHPLQPTCCSYPGCHLSSCATNTTAA